MTSGADYIERYTTASKLNDVHGTITLKDRIGVTSTGHEIRLVAIPEDSLVEQLKYYVSGLFMVMDEQEWKIEQQFGNVIPLVDEDEFNAESS
ncbi:MAG: hypothetical protein HUJ29_09755 [Gammaproteobacteria bacterium]|nr:hypothetical protein [Gammaproteobacteria bacterium]